MDIRSLDGDDPATIDLLLPGFRETMSLELPGDPPVSPALLARLLQRLRRRRPDRPRGVRRRPASSCTKLGLDLGVPDGPGHGSLWVFPGFRRRGAGTALFSAARTELRARGRDLLMVDAPHTPAAERFAAACGAEALGTNLRNRLLLKGPGRAGLDAAAARCRGTGSSTGAAAAPTSWSTPTPVPGAPWRRRPTARRRCAVPPPPTYAPVRPRRSAPGTART